MIKPALSGYPLAELRELLSDSPARGTVLPFRAAQIFSAIAQGVSSLEEITTLPRALRTELETRFTLRSTLVSRRLSDPDGTEKLRISLQDGLAIEAVLLEDGRGRKTACLSTQAGCPAGCVFCKTGSLGFSRNLNGGEMVEQFLHLRSLCPEIANIVIMGMGEPLLNLEELRRALAVLTDPGGLRLSPRRITLSTCGIVAGIRDLADRGPELRLALSLTTADESLRGRLMPISRSNPLAALREALGYYQDRCRRRITLETVLLSGINTRREDANALGRFAEGLNTVINLIPWNSVEGLSFEGRPLREPEGRELSRFAAFLQSRGLKVTLRRRKGRNIYGACGQLGNTVS
jgi:23S rRNA (adenine2503-C2)-methyltransferase